MSLLNNSNAIPTTGGGYNLENSLRLRSSASAYLSRTPTVAGNQKTWTFSCWVKFGDIGSGYATLFSGGTVISGTQGGNRIALYMSSNQLILNIGGIGSSITTSAVFRDPSAWYHVVGVLDTPQADSADRAIIYVNGVRQTVTTGFTYNQNESFGVNTTQLHAIGTFSNSIGSFNTDGYQTEVNFVDGQALTPSDFGDYNSDTGVWQPIKYTGTYGTNGFYLPMNQTVETYDATYLVVAGGGSGGSASNSGGGGAGGYRTATVPIIVSNTYDITVGNGGAAVGSGAGVNGSDSSILGTGLSIISAGGGGGGSTTGSGLNGGSGGGGGTNSRPGGLGNTPSTSPSQGNNGGNGGPYSGQYAGGGGGGAGTVGFIANSPVNPGGGYGGNGLASSITGTSVTRAGGGGGGCESVIGLGGSGGGGNGGSNSSPNGVSGTINTGSGGGAGEAAGVSGAGGSGIVILRVPTAKYTGTVTGSPTVTTDGSDTVIKFTANGTYTA